MVKHSTLRWFGLLKRMAGDNRGIARMECAVGIKEFFLLGVGIVEREEDRCMRDMKNARLY